MYTYERYMKCSNIPTKGILKNFSTVSTSHTSFSFDKIIVKQENTAKETKSN